MIPKKYMDLVGTKQKLMGGIFSSTKDLKPTEFDVLDIRWGTAKVVNIKELAETGESSYEHPTYELLLKRSGMKRAQWSRPLCIDEIDLTKESNKKQ